MVKMNLSYLAKEKRKKKEERVNDEYASRTYTSLKKKNGF